MEFSIKDFFSKCDQIRSFLRVWLHLLKKSWMENFFLCNDAWNTAFDPVIFFWKLISRWLAEKIRPFSDKISFGFFQTTYFEVYY